MSVKQKARLKRVLISAAGTGGHIFPGLAVAKALQELEVEVSWLGSERRLDQTLVSGALPFYALPMQAWRGKGLLGRVRTLLSLVASCWKAWRYIRRFSPDVILTFGGYVTVPVGLMAWLSGVPLLAHEQNSIAGSANRLLARFASTMLCAFPNVFVKSVVCGNPLRSGFLIPNTQKSMPEKVCHVLVLGGSLGASAINTAVVECVLAWGDRLPALSVQHQTGESDYKRVKAMYGDAPIEVQAFIDDMPAAMRRADLIIARSGALTVSEIAAIGVASILVPYPKAIDDHQFSNAMVLGDVGGAIVVREDRLTADHLASIVSSLLEDPGRCEAMGKAALSVHRPDAVATIVRACELAVKGEETVTAD